ncbi:MAG TPA: hypothetical protein VI699_09170 [Candidatus Acidoferrales bacterium]|nr:hypothetical protein [Candidatus Acidoferrales bacterium]
MVTADGARISYRRVFKSSYPEFIEIRVSENGSCTYDIRQLDEDPDPKLGEVSAPLRAKIFELAAQLGNFQGVELDVRRRIANLGQKTFRYEGNGQVHEVSFNYTLDSHANQLMQIFEGLARQQEHLVKLQRRMKYDRLGVNDALMHLESDLNRRNLPEPQRLLPTLEQIANDPRVVEIARQRARTLAQRIRSAS